VQISALEERAFTKKCDFGVAFQMGLDPARHLLMERVLRWKVGNGVRGANAARVIHLNSRFQLFVCYEKQACKLPGRCVATPGPKWLVTI
jgi:hypothetical protein